MSVEKLVKQLQDLNSDDSGLTPEQQIGLVRKILESIFEIEIAKIQLTENDKKIIGPLIKKSFDAIELWISTTEKEIEDGTGQIDTGYYIIPRSGLEFLLKRYGDLPNGEGYSLDEDLRLTVDMDEWDEQFRWTVDDSYYHIPQEVPSLSDDEMACIPKTHWWWNDPWHIFEKTRLTRCKITRELNKDIYNYDVDDMDMDFDYLPIASESSFSDISFVSNNEFSKIAFDDLTFMDVGKPDQDGPSTNADEIKNENDQTNKMSGDENVDMRNFKRSLDIIDSSEDDRKDVEALPNPYKRPRHDNEETNIVMDESDIFLDL